MNAEVIKEEPYVIVDTVMGTAVSAKIWGEDLTEELMACLHAWDERISWRIDTSEIAILNQSALYEEGVKISDEVGAYLKDILTLCEKSQGSFDITLGEIVRLWNVESDSWVMPKSEEIAYLLGQAGYENISYEKESFFLEKECFVDLGAVGKGIGCSEAELLLREKEIPAATVSVGGSILTFGEKPDGSSWNIAITNPRKEDDNTYLGVLKLDGTNAISTSGDYEKYVMSEGIRYHHILDPQTGYPAKSGLISSTIVCEEGWLSDALSTACFVMGYPDCLLLLSDYQAEGVFVTEEKEVWITDGLKDSFVLLDDNYKIQEERSTEACTETNENQEYDE